MKLDRTKSPSIPCLGDKCLNRVPFEFENQKNNRQLCDNCYKKVLEEEQKEERLKQAIEIEAEKHRRKKPQLKNCGQCGNVWDFKKNKAPCPKCYPINEKKKF